MKKMIFLLFLCITLTACGNKNKKYDETTQKQETTTENIKETTMVSIEKNNEDIIKEILPIFKFNEKEYDLRNKINKFDFIEENNLIGFKYNNPFSLTKDASTKEVEIDKTSTFTEKNKDEYIYFDWYNKDNTIYKFEQSFMMWKDGKLSYIGNVHTDIADITYPLNLRIGDNAEKFLTYVESGVFVPMKDNTYPNFYVNKENPDCPDFKYSIGINNNIITHISFIYKFQ